MPRVSHQGLQLSQRVITFSLSITKHCRSVFTGLVWGALLAVACAAPPALDCGLPLQNGVHTSTDGTVDLKWMDDSAASYQLEERSPSSDGNYKLRYEGPDISSVRSGMAEGTHVFRVRIIDSNGEPGPWSQPLTVEVKFMDAGRVRLLLILGGIVVIATVIAILHGHLSHRRKEAAV